MTVMNSSNQTAETIAKTVLEFFPDTEAIYLFGSHNTEHERPESDVDVGLLLPPDTAKTISNQTMGECVFALEDALRKSVDLINLRAVNMVFQHEIIQEGKTILKRNEYAVAEYEMLVMSLYQKLNEERAGILQEISKTGRIIGS